MEHVYHFVFLTSIGLGLFIAFALFKQRSLNPSGFQWLIMLLVSLCLVILEQWTIMAVPDTWQYLNRITIWLPFTFGPFLWFYSQNISQDESRSPQFYLLHLAPALLCLLYFLPYLFSSYEDKLLGRSLDTPIDIMVIAYLKASSMVIYSAMSYQMLKAHLVKRHSAFVQRISKAIAILLTMFVFAGVTFTAESFLGELWIPADILGAGSLAIFIYYLGYQTVSGWTEYVRSLSGKKSSDPLLEEQETQTVFDHILQVATDKQLYLSPGISVNELAAKLELPAHYLSYVINRQTQDNVQNWLNDLRVSYVIEMMQAAPQKSLLSLALDSGFNSKATFNRAFKKKTGLSPSQFKANYE